MIEVRRNAAGRQGGLSGVFVLLFMDACAWVNGNLDAALGAGTVTLLVVAHVAWRWRRPELSGTADGLSVRGSRMIPWRDIDTLYEVPVSTRSSWDHTGTKPSPAICVPFYRRRPMFKLPMSMWPGALARHGVNIPVAGVPARIIADLELLRGTAPDARPLERRASDAAELPAARLQRRSRPEQ